MDKPPGCTPASRKRASTSTAAAISCATVTPFRIAHTAPRHLVPAAESEHPSTGPRMRDDVVVPPLRAKECELRQGRFRSGQQHDIGVARDRFTRRDKSEVDGRFHPEGIDVVEVRDA